MALHAYVYTCLKHDPHKDVNFAIKAVFSDGFTQEEMILAKILLHHVMRLEMNYAVP